MNPLGRPYCANCEYDLSGAVASATCPECGKPLSEVLVRAPTTNTSEYRRYRSNTVIFGYPLLDIAFGADPGKAAGKARGWIALGDDAIGLFALGGVARGGIACGGLAMGVIACGGCSVGLGLATGGLAVAGAAAFGGAAVSGYFAVGGIAVSHIAKGGLQIPLW